MFILFGLTAALSMVLNIFLVPLLEVQINQEMLIAQTALRQNEFFLSSQTKTEYMKKGTRVLKENRAELNAIFFFSRDHLTRA